MREHKGFTQDMNSSKPVAQLNVFELMAKNITHGELESEQLRSKEVTLCLDGL